VLQTKHQKFVSVQRAALIFSLEPVFAAIFDAMISQRLPSPDIFLGGGVILLSIFYLELAKKKSSEVSSSP
jgi:drug/metabolite transporter (DMT)-like permease